MAHELSMDVLRKIRLAGVLTRSELAHTFGISLSLTRKITTELLEMELIIQRATPEPSTGRPAHQLAINPHAGFAIGVDVGNLTQRVVMTNLLGDVLASLEEKASDTSVRVECIEDLAKRVTDASGVSPDEVLGLGVGINHIVDPITGITYRLPISWEPTPDYQVLHIPVKDQLMKRISIPHIKVDDIVRTLGIAEYHYGLGVGEKNFIYLLVDSGIRLAIMLNGEPFIGASHIAGEIAHIPVRNQTTVCNCGNTGCLGILASAGPLVEKVRQRLTDSTIWSGLRMLPDISIDDILAAGDHGDKIATQVLNEAGEYTGDAMAAVLNLFGPGLVIIGGRIARSNVFYEATGRFMRMHALEMAARDVKLKGSLLDEWAGARGAAIMAINGLFEPGDMDLVHLGERRIP